MSDIPELWCGENLIHGSHNWNRGTGKQGETYFCGGTTQPRYPKLDASVFPPRPVEEVRTVSSTGGEKGVKPQRHSLIPSEALDTVAELYNFGTEKYSAHNWRKGYEWSKSIDSLLRHAHKFNAGEDIDPETKLPHLAGVVFHALTLITFMSEHPEFDDRYKPEIKKISGAIINDGIIASTGSVGGSIHVNQINPDVLKGVRYA